MPTRVSVSRNAGHPWDGRPGFDLMELNADTQEEMDAAVKRAEAKFWSPWLIGTHETTKKPGGLMYKPSGIMEPWQDSYHQPHPGSSTPA